MIRRMEPGDLEQVAELEKLCFSEPWSYGILEAGIHSPSTCIMYTNGTERSGATATCACWQGRGRSSG